MLSSRWNNSGQIASATSTISSSSPKSANSTNKNIQKLSSPFRKPPASPFRKRGIPGTQSQSITEAQSNSPSFLSNGTQISNPTYQYYVSKNQSAIPVSIILRNQHIKYKTKRKQWRNRPASLFKTTLEIFYEEEISRTAQKQLPGPIERRDSDVSALSAISDDENSEENSDCTPRPEFSSPGKQRFVVYSKDHEASLHASWNNLEDLIYSLQADLSREPGKYAWFHDPRYESLKARVYISKDDIDRFHASHSKFLQQDMTEDNSVDSDTLPESSFDTTFICQNFEEKKLFEASATRIKESEDLSITIAIIPLHPTLLRRLPPPLNNQNSASSKTTIPSALPPNTLLIQYSDGSLRIIPPLYKLLLKNDIISEKDFDVDGTDGKDYLEADRIEENKRTIRFSDNAFKALKKVEKKNGNGHKKFGNRQGFELYPEDNLYSLLGDTNVDKSNGIAQDPSFNGTEPKTGKNDVFDDVWRDLKPAIDRVEKNHNIDVPINIVENAQDLESRHEDGSLLREEPDSTDFDAHITLDAQNGIENVTQAQESLKSENLMLRLQVEQLEKLITHEEESLEEDEEKIITECNKVKSLVKDVQELVKNSSLINSEIVKLNERFSQTEFLISTRQSKLVKELSQIYPIKSLSQNRYAIRNLEIPTDLSTLFHSSTHDDQHISSALGYTTHAVYMCSKYLVLPLRYKLLCNASRSAVQGDQNGILFPLFKDKVEKEQFDIAITLLDRNVDCLLFAGKWRVNLDTNEPLNMLDKLSRLFQRVMLIDSKDGDHEK